MKCQAVKPKVFGMSPAGPDFIDLSELESKLLSEPAFSGGRLHFVRRLPARSSDVLEYAFHSGNATKLVVVKRRPFGPDSETTICKEFAGLNRVRMLLGLSLGRSVPDPLLVLPKSGILVTRKVSGTPLAIILKKRANRLTGPFCTSTITQIARRAGLWLRRFQDATRSRPITYNTVSFLADLKLRLSQCEEKGLESDLSQEILKRASVQSACLHGRLVSSAARHGDFIPQNILINGNEVAVVDFEGLSEREAIYDDVAVFLGYLLLSSVRPLYCPHSLDTASRAFLGGFLAGDSMDNALLNTYMLKSVVRIISDGPPLAKNWRRLGTAWIIRKRLKELLSGGALLPS